MSTSLDTPYKNKPDEIQVTDPMHPLYGRVFTVISITSGIQPGSGQVFVTRKEGVTLRIPLQATNRSTAVSSVATKLMLSGLEELIALAQECEVLLWPPGPKVVREGLSPKNQSQILADPAGSDR
jgi:hypothetical protein